MSLYPLKFKPILKTKVWGGDRIGTIYRHASRKKGKVGESWDVVAMDEKNDSVVYNGYLEGNTLSEVTEIYMGELVGDKVYETYGCGFPLIVKIIDAKEKLSVQVHPNDELARRNGEFGGKNEMWYVIDAEPGAYVMLGFNREVSEDELRRRSQEGTVEEVLQRFDVERGDVFHIPAGTVHALGSGCLVAEIQEASDVTYRLYDYNRLDGGKPRKLHLEEALEAIDYEHWQGRKIGLKPELNGVVNIVEDEKFAVNLIEIDQPKSYEKNQVDSCVVLTCVEGHVSLQFDGDYITIVDGESILIPAEMDNLIMVPTVKSKILETSIKS